MNELVALQDVKAPTRPYDVLAEVRAENLWLANFTSDNTRDSYRTAVADFIGALGIADAEALYAVSQAHIIAYRDHLKSAGHSNATIAARLSALSSLYKFLADRQLCPSNPVSGVRRPTTGGNGLGSGKTPALARAQVRAMLDAPDPDTLQGLRDRAILHVYFYTGGRCSEPGSLKVRSFRQDRDYWVLEFQTKGDKTLTVAIHPECKIAIQRYLDLVGHGDDKDAPLFRAVKVGKNQGGPLARQTFYQLFRKYARQAGIEGDCPPHSARATFITEAYEAGLMGEDIQRTVGHASITTTEGYNRTAQRHRKSASFGVNYG